MKSVSTGHVRGQLFWFGVDKDTFVKDLDRGDKFDINFTQDSGLFSVQYRQVLRLNVIVNLYRILDSEHTGLI